MTQAERGYLLLCADLGTGLAPLRLPQLRTLRARIRQSAMPPDAGRTPAVEDLRRLGYDTPQAAHIVALLAQEQALDAYLAQAKQNGITPLTIASPGYPQALRDQLGDRAPAVLFCRGDRQLLCGSYVSLVGSRQIGPLGAAFAERVGSLAAREGYVLVSGNAPGADQIAQRACLEAGGQVLSVVAGSLTEPALAPRLLYVCEDGWHLPFSPLRALQRNRLIHAMGGRVFVAQSSYGSGGTWHGTLDALRMGLGPVYVCSDGSRAANALAEQGAYLLAPEELTEICTLLPPQRSLFDPER